MVLRFYIPLKSFSFQSSFDSSAGRAVDCSGILKSIGRWFESGSKETEFFFLLS